MMKKNLFAAGSLAVLASVVYFATRDSRDNTNQPVNSGPPLDVWAAPTETPVPTAVPAADAGIGQPLVHVIAILLGVVLGFFMIRMIKSRKR